MKVLQISHRYHIAGGSDAVFFATSDALTAAGHEVVPFSVASPRNRPSPYERYFPQAADTGKARPREIGRYFYNRDAAQSLEALIRDHGPFDVAHLHIYHGKQTPAILPVLRRHGIAVVHSLHEYKLACPVYTMERGGAPCEDCLTKTSLQAVRRRCKDGSFLRSAAMWAEFKLARALGDVRLVDRFLCVSAFQKSVMERSGIDPAKLHLLHNFTQSPATVPEGHDGYLLYIGRIEALKGLGSLIEAVRMTGHVLKIAGDGAWTGDMLAQIAGLPNVSYLGFQGGEDLTRLVSRAHAVVVPSQWYENCPMSVLEAKALGRPVIGADIGGIPELVRDGADGFLHAPGDAESLAQAMERLEAANWHALSQAAAADQAARFSQVGHMDALLRHYRGAGAKTDAPQEPGEIRRPLRRSQAAFDDQNSVTRPSQKPEVALVK